MKDSIQNTKSQVRLPLLLSLAITGGILIGANMFGGQNMKSITKAYLKFREILTYIDRNYVDSVDTDSLVDYSITMMLEKLDPHTVYIPAEDVKQAHQELEGNFEGIGIEFNIFKDTIFVVAPLPGGPSEAVGLQSGDRIVSVDGVPVAGPDIQPDNLKVYKWLRGQKGTEVKLGIKRYGEDDLLDFTVIRDKIPQNSIDVSYMVNKQVGYIKVRSFGATTYTEFRNAVKELKKSGMKRLMLDLRDNRGGYLDKAVKMVDEMIGGNAKIVYTDGKGTKYDTEYRAKFDGLFEKGPIIVLVNENSASASEIVAGALQDNDRALIVGRRSFGKGLVQMPLNLTDGSELRLTISRYYTPSGRSIQKPYQDYSEYNSHGELFSRDSIRLDDDQKYKTRKGRTVYGGGGIIPDHFVALDTARFPYLNKLYNQNLVREFALNYFKDHESKLNEYSIQEFSESFRFSEEDMKSLIARGEAAGIAYDEEDYKQSEEMIQHYLKAFVGKSLWDSEGFYRVFNQKDEDFQEALGLFEEAIQLAKSSKK